MSPVPAPVPRPGGGRVRLWLERLRGAMREGDLGGAVRRTLLRLLVNRNPRLGGALAYRLWMAEHERPTRTAPVVVADRPRVSVIPADPEVDLASLTADLRRQEGVEWELCPLPGMAPDRPRLWEALAAATGDVMVLLDAHTRLAPGALQALAEAVADEGSLAYGDVDHLAPDGRRFAPLLKPASPGVMLLGMDLLAPVTGFRRSLLAAVADTAGESAATALSLRLDLAGAAPVIRHIPRVLAHRGLGPGEAPADWRLHGDAAARAVRRLVDRRGPGWEVRQDDEGRLRIVPPLPDDPLVSIVIPTRDRADLLRACVDSIARHTLAPRYELLIVDNGSSKPEAVDLLRDLASRPGTRVLPSPGPFNWSALNNCAARQATGEVLVFLNNDTEVLHGGWLEELTRWALADGVGTAGALLLRADHTVQHAGVGIGFGGVCAHPLEGLPAAAATVAGPVDTYRTCIAVTGACLAVSRATLAALGGFSERFQVLFSDVELGLRAWQAGLPSLVTPHARLLHHHGQSRGGDTHMIPDDILRARELFPRDLISADPCWSRHLSRWSAVPRLARQGEPETAAFLDAFAEELETTFTPRQRQAAQPVQGPAQRALRGLRS